MTLPTDTNSAPQVLETNHQPGTGMLDAQAAMNSVPEQPKQRISTVFSRRTASLMGVRTIGLGAYAPDNVVTNEDLRKTRGFDPEWIEQRTGILERRHVTEGQATSDLCTEAARKAMASAGVYAADVDLLVVGTFTPDYTCPSTACLVQERLGIDAPAFDVSAACSGFVYALVTAAQYVATGNAKLALVIGGDCNSRIVDPNDRKIAPLFGDGAGAFLLAPGSRDQGLVCYQMGADGSGGPLLDRPAGGTKNQLTAAELNAGRHYLRMDGRNVFKWAVRAVAETIRIVLESAEMKPEDVSLYALHQANMRIVDAVCDQLNLPRERIFNNIQKYGNTSAGSIPLLLNDAYNEGRIQKGDTILMSGFGAGLTWGTSLYRW